MKTTIPMRHGTLIEIEDIDDQGKKKIRREFWGQCRDCGVALPPFKKINTEASIGNPCAAGIAIGRHEDGAPLFYLCADCHTTFTARNCFDQTTMGRIASLMPEDSDSGIASRIENLRETLCIREN